MYKISPNKRALNQGYSWQKYAVKAIRFITKEDVDTKYNGTRSGVVDGSNDWSKGITQYIIQRCDQLGLVIEQILSQLIEEPNEDKTIEKLIWDQRNSVYVFSCWAHILGPVPSEVVTDTILPVLGFWPNEAIPHGAVAEIYDATVLSPKEKQSIALL